MKSVFRPYTTFFALLLVVGLTLFVISLFTEHTDLQENIALLIGGLLIVAGLIWLWVAREFLLLSTQKELKDMKKLYAEKIKNPSGNSRPKG